MEIRITEEGVIPCSRSQDHAGPIPDENNTTDTNETMVRTIVRPVGRVGLEPTTDGL